MQSTLINRDLEFGGMKAWEEWGRAQGQKGDIGNLGAKLNLESKRQVERFHGRNIEKMFKRK